MPETPAPLADPSLSVETPERVALTLDVAGLGTRALSYLVDLFILFLFWVVVVLGISVAKAGGLSTDDFYGLAAVMQALLIFAVWGVQWGYWVLFETLWAGRSPGKRLVHIRVVRTDGSPIGFTEAALRNLARLVDFLPVLYTVGMVTMVIDRRGRRVGDLVAGTLVVRERRADLSRYDAPAQGSPAAPVTLSAAEYELVTSFLSRAGQLEPEARVRVALKVAAPLVARLPAEKRAAPLADGAAAESFLRSLVGHG